MKFAADHHFSISRTHLNAGKPCQDYAFSGIYGDAAFAIVADGCSTGHHTDVGARIIALSAVHAVRELVRSGEVTREKIDRAQEAGLTHARESFGLDLMDMLATSGSIFLTAQGGWVHLRGDGVVALMYRDGRIVLDKFNWNENRPLYPAYAQDNYRGFIHAHGGNLDQEVLKATWVNYSPASGFSEGGSAGISLIEGIRGTTRVIKPEELQDLACVAVFSDGVTQIEGVDWKEAALQLLSFKNTTGEFMKRRMIKFIKGLKGDLLLDDLACAVIHIDHDEPEDGGTG